MLFINGMTPPPAARAPPLADEGRKDNYGVGINVTTTP
jgi:hypothetical protein